MSLAKRVIHLVERDLTKRWTEPIQRTYPKFTTTYDLIQASQKFFDGRNLKSAPTVTISNVELIPMIGMNSLMIRSGGMGSEPSKPHVQIVQLYDIHFSDKPIVGHIQAVDTKTRKPFWFKPAAAKVNRTAIWCNCGDFQWRCAWSIDHRFHALAAKLANEIAGYVRKTPDPPVGRPYGNPGDVPTGCKHTLQLLQTLIYNGAIV
jgi:hypothetical protein